MCYQHRSLMEAGRNPENLVLFGARERSTSQVACGNPRNTAQHGDLTLKDMLLNNYHYHYYSYYCYHSYYYVFFQVASLQFDVQRILSMLGGGSVSILYFHTMFIFSCCSVEKLRTMLTHFEVPCWPRKPTPLRTTSIAWAGHLVSQP